MLQAGDRLGPYEIVGLLGSGGMGEVYRARDARLGREVAIKVLGAAFAADSERLRRFEQEARTLAALNHPNLMAVFDFGTHDGGPYLVSELLLGETLQARLESGPVGARKAGEWGGQIAAGLAAAHQQGIVHRDLKPANLFIAQDGRVKILDFGLAKMAQAAVGPDDATLLSGATAPGMTLGTVGYMAPEQVRGEAADARADIFAFGVVLYEMLTGVRPFHRSTAADTMTAILRDEPAEFPAEAAGVTPGFNRLERIVRRCLEKQSQQRFQSASDLEFALQSAGGTSVSSSRMAPANGLPAPSAQRNSQGWWKWLAGGAVGAAVAWAVAWGLRPQPFDLGQLTYTPFAFAAGGQDSPVWSPDGKAVAYAASATTGSPSQVVVRYLNSQTVTPLTHLDENASPFAWMPDNSRVLFVTQHGIYSVSTTGGTPTQLLDTAQGPAQGFGKMNGSGALALSPDGRALVGIWRVPDGKYGLGISSPPGAAPKPYPAGGFEAEEFFNQPSLAFAPNGQQLLLLEHGAVRGRDEQWLLPWPASAGKPRQVMSWMPQSGVTPSFAWLPNSREVVLSVFASGAFTTRLYRAAVDGSAHAAVSPADRVLTQPAISPDGRQLIYTEHNENYDVVEADLTTGAITPLLDSSRNESTPAWAAHAPLLAYEGDLTGSIEVWLHAPGRPDRPLLDTTTAAELLLNPYPSPDGARVVFARLGAAGGGGPKRSSYQLWIASMAGGRPERLTDNPSSVFENGGAWSPDGSQFALRQNGNLAIVTTGGQASPKVLVPGINANLPVWSPTGQWIAYRSNPDSRGGDAWWLISPDGKQTRSLGKLNTASLAFSRDGQTLYGILDDARVELFSLPLAGGPPHILAALGAANAPHSLSNPGLHFTLAPDGKHLTYSVSLPSSNLWLVSGLRP